MIIRQKREYSAASGWSATIESISLRSRNKLGRYRESLLRHDDPGFRCQTRDTEITVSSNTFFPSLSLSLFSPPFDRRSIAMGTGDTFVIVEIADASKRGQRKGPPYCKVQPESAQKIYSVLSLYIKNDS